MIKNRKGEEPKPVTELSSPHRGKRHKTRQQRKTSQANGHPTSPGRQSYDTEPFCQRPKELTPHEVFGKSGQPEPTRNDIFQVTLYPRIASYENREAGSSGGVTLRWNSKHVITPWATNHAATTGPGWTPPTDVSC